MKTIGATRSDFVIRHSMRFATICQVATFVIVLAYFISLGGHTPFEWPVKTGLVTAFVMSWVVGHALKRIRRRSPEEA